VELHAGLRLGDYDVVGHHRCLYSHDVSTDGTRFLMIKPVEDDGGSSIAVALNWLKDGKAPPPAAR
jgi:hypothetical protein